MTFYVTTAPYHLNRRWSQRPAEADGLRPLPVNIRGEEDSFVLTAFVPGLKAEDLNIQIIEDTLLLEGEYNLPEGSYLMSELPTGAFRRSLRLPAQLDAEKAEAQIEDGVLTLRLPKAESARPKTIKINAHLS